MSPISIPSVVVVLLTTLAMSSAQPTTKIVVSAGEYDRTNAIVECPIGGNSFGEHSVVRLASADGEISILGQIGSPKLNSKVPDEFNVLTFVLPKSASLKGGTTLELVVSPADDSAVSFKWIDQMKLQRTLSIKDRPVLIYVYESRDTSSPERIDETFKPYHHLFDPSGKRVVTKGIGGLYPHHRGLSFAFNGISYLDRQADVWHCRDGEFQSHEEFISEDVGPVYGRHRVQIDWHGRDGAVFASEIRELTAYAVEGANLIEFRSLLSTTLPSVRLAGDPQHAGFQFRASQEVADQTKEQTYYLRPDGPDKPGAFRNWSNAPEENEVNRNHVNLPWNSLSFVLSSQRYTCCYLDHPANPKPARFSERDYGRFGSDFEYKLEPERPLEVGYRLFLKEGEMVVDSVKELSRDFVEPCQAELKLQQP